MPETTPVARKGDWIQLASGSPFWPLDPRPNEVHIIDIAWGLAHQCRYAGQVKQFYSVAEHAILVSHAVPPADALCGLLHDASEALGLPDLPRPIKQFMPEYRAAEDIIMECVAQKFGFPWPMPESVQEMDGRILVNERVAIMGEPPYPWADTGPALPDIVINCWEPKLAYQNFIARYREIVGAKRW